MWGFVLESWFWTWALIFITWTPWKRSEIQHFENPAMIAWLAQAVIELSAPGERMGYYIWLTNLFIITGAGSHKTAGQEQWQVHPIQWICGVVSKHCKPRPVIFPLGQHYVEQKWNLRLQQSFRGVVHWTIRVAVYISSNHLCLLLREPAN